MKKISCNVYQDILPLYADDVVSRDTREFVEEHLRECAACRAELEQMKRPIQLPMESEKPLESIRREWKKKDATIWRLSLALLAVFLLMALPVFDTAMQYHIQEIVGDIVDYWMLLLPLAAVGFGLEWWFLRLRKAKWLKYLPVILPALVVVYAEVAWTAGGWNRIGSSVLWYASFPVLLGSSCAALLKATLAQPRWAKMVVAAVFAGFVLLAAIFWPKSLYKTIDMKPDLVMVEDDVRWEISQENLDVTLQFAKISICTSAPEWDPERCILLRLNENYILAAPYGDTPYIYEYAGALEDFSGKNVRYRVYSYPALYIELKTASTPLDP